MTDQAERFLLAAANRFGGMTRAQIKALMEPVVMLAHAYGMAFVEAEKVMAELERADREKLDEGAE